MTASVLPAVPTDRQGKAPAEEPPSPRTSAGATCRWVLEHDGHGHVTAWCGERTLPCERLCAEHYIAAVGSAHR